MKKIVVFCIAVLNMGLVLSPRVVLANTGHSKPDYSHNSISGDPSDSNEDKHSDEDEHSDGEGHHSIAHPFFTHMGLPDGVGGANIRTNIISQNSDEGNRTDYGVHLETGLAENWGFHYRNDGIKDRLYSEAMVQYAIWKDRAGTSGISIFGQLGIRNSSAASDDVKGAFGVSGRKSFSRVALDGNVHYKPKEDGWELEGAAVYKLNHRVFPLLEIRAEIENETQPVYILPGVKFKVWDGMYLGFGAQLPITSDREYDVQTLAQIDFSF